MLTYHHSHDFIPANKVDPLCDKFVKNCTIDDNDCWIWNGALFTSGYGKIKIARKSWYVHRLSACLFHDSFDPTLVVCHECPNAHNKACCNPYHLKQGTQKDNMSHPLTRELLRQKAYEYLSRQQRGM